MKTKHILILVGTIVCATAFAEYEQYDCQAAMNVIGDWRLVTLGGFTLAKPISVDLAPANVPDENGHYSIRCRIIYKDNAIPRPMSDADWERVRRTGDDLRTWLNNFIVGECAGRAYEDLFRAYMLGKFVENLNTHFPSYIAKQISAMESSERPDIDTVTVEVEAEGTFREDLKKAMTRASQEEQEREE